MCVFSREARLLMNSVMTINLMIDWWETKVHTNRQLIPLFFLARLVFW